MSTSFHYPHGVPIRNGDRVVIEGGRKQGVVVEIVDHEEFARTLAVKGRGIVVDAEPGGLVFLEGGCLAEDPPRFVRRGPGGWTRFLARMALGLGMVLLVPALVSLASAIYSAATTGEVLVLYIGRRDGKVESVPWAWGWARFAGPVLLLAATVLGIASRRWSFCWFMACAASGLGVAMLLESWLFTTVAGSLIAVAAFFGVPLVVSRLSKERAPL